VFVKDLRVLKNRELRNLVIVDNAAYAFGLQLENGIPILPFFSDQNDKELPALAELLKRVSLAQDVREVLAQKLKLRQFANYSETSKLVAELYLRPLEKKQFCIL